MKILVRRKGWGIIKPPEDIPKWFQGQNTLIINPVWEEFHRDQPLIRAVNMLEEDLPIGEYGAVLTWQYHSNISNSWFNTDEPRQWVVKDIPIRLVFVKTYSTSDTSKISQAKCGVCKVPLYKYEEEAGVCSYCNTSAQGTDVIKNYIKKQALL